MVSKKYVWFADDHREVFEGEIDINEPLPHAADVPDLEFWALRGYGGMQMSQYLRWGKPLNSRGANKPLGGAICDAVDMQAQRNDIEGLEAWFAVAPGCRASFEATSGLEYSPSVGAFVGYQAPGVAPIEDAALIATVPAVIVAPPPPPPPPPPVAAEPMPAIDCAAGECPWDGSGPAPVAAVAPFPEGDIDVGPMFKEVPAIVLADPALTPGLEVGVSISWGTIVAVILILLAAYWFFNQ